MWVHDLRDADASCGGKAVGLARLISGGLAVPAGFAIDDRAFRHVVGELELGDPDAIGHVLAAAAERIEHAELPPELERDVRERAKDLGATLAVRSSATIEDGLAGAGAGVFSSRRAVPVADVWNAIRAVWISALTPLAAAYARQRHATIAIGVVIQEFVEGNPIVVYTRPPGAPDASELLLQRGEHLSRFSRDDLPREIEAEHAAVLALRAEQVIGATAGADVELVQLRKQYGFEVVIQTWVVQARPIVHPTRVPHALPPPAIVLAPLADGRIWTWDIAHNPAPLSVAQAGLVERVDRAAAAPYSLRVCAGYLYSSPRDDAPPLPLVSSAADLATRAAALESRLEALVADPPSTVAAAIERYVEFYRVWASELSPLIASARSQSAGFHVPSRPSSVEAVLAAAARGEISEADVDRRLGAFAPCWDVATPTFGERPGVLRDAVSRAGSGVPQPTDGHDLREIATLPGVTQPTGGQLATIAADLAERDDALFARAQGLVRRSLIARAIELGVELDDIFWLPLGETSALDPIDPEAAHRRASAARAAAARTTRWEMPLRVGGPPPQPGKTLQGVGNGPRVTGRVVRFASLASAAFVGAGDVVVVRAVTPALAVFVGRCAAIVSESGGLLDHGAALARELGITCVVGCHDAWHLLTDGNIVSVDGDAGIVTAAATQSSSS